MFFWIYDLPNWQGAVIFTVVITAFTLLGVIATRSMVQRLVKTQSGWNEALGAFLSAYGVFYGLLAGLVAVATYQNYSDTERTVSREASSLAALYRDISSYPQPICGELQQVLQDYTNVVIESDWPRQQQGVIPEEGTTKLTAFQIKLIAVEPQGKGQEILHAEALRQFNEYVDRRRQRLQSVGSGLPDILWYVLGVGAFFNIVLIWLFNIERLSLHLVLAGILSLLIALMIFLIAAMDYPFRGSVSISAEPFELLRGSLMRGN